MKPLHTALLASTFLCVTYVAVPARANSTWITQVASIEPPRLEKNTNDAVDLALDAAINGFPIRDEVEGIQNTLDTEEVARFGVPGACVIQTQLAEELGDLYERARAFRAHFFDVRFAQFQIVLGRYERALLDIQTAWKNGEIADDIAVKAMATMRVDALDYLENLGAVTEVRTRLYEAIAELVARGQDAMDRANASRDAFRKLYELRFEAAWAVFKARFENGDWDKYDYERLQEILNALRNLDLHGRPYDCEL